MEKTIKKTGSLMVIVFLFLFAPILLAFNPAPSSWGKTYKLSTLNQSEVKNSKGEILGKIEDFVLDPQGGRVALVIFSHPGVAGMGHKVKIIPYELLSYDETGKNFVLDISKEDLASPLEVKNLQGEKLGEIKDFVIDSRGRVPFAMLSHGGKMIAVPYSALWVEQGGSFFVMDANEEKLASAPAVGEKENSINQAKAREIYKYFGQSPYWTE